MTDENVQNTDKPNYPETTPMAADKAKADSTDRQSRSLVKDNPVGPMVPANSKTTR